MTINGGISFWHATDTTGVPTTAGAKDPAGAAGTPPPPRPATRAPLTGDATADVVIVGGGYTGLWTAYYLKRSAPGLRVTVLEQKFCGYGASGRNGGWLYNGVAGRDRYAALHGHRAALRLQHAMNDTVTEVIDVAAAEGIDADIHRGGVLEVARTPAQLSRLRQFHAAERSFGEDDRELYGAAATRARIDIADAVGSTWTPHGARVHPLKLLKGLAAACERLGVVVHESTPVTEIAPRRAVTPYGTVRAPYVLRCTEGFTAALKGQRRAWLPMNSSMIVTAPLPPETWARLGWTGGEVLGDMAHAYMYAQRTADDRIAIGGRGVPYRFGSRTDHDGRTRPATVDALTALLTSFFPPLAGTEITHAWSGVLGVPRDWCASVCLDHATGLGWAGGYVGSGVATSNLAARTLRDLVRRDATELTTLPWVGHRVRRWEPEPLRWLGVQALYAAYREADRHESATHRPTTTPLARLANRVSGRH
ncbi:NAD(P)/FAD-dependent oxidoreductase [Streptomyces sp. NPDC051567]|uniref:NAD(P)/FAD-dependent oxidoreductase n=1 Tax=Streptomyces sp. NPDC051567 TaxID=3365660 RepID=UPI0037A3AE9E